LCSYIFCPTWCNWIAGSVGIPIPNPGVLIPDLTPEVTLISSILLSGNSILLALGVLSLFNFKLTCSNNFPVSTAGSKLLLVLAHDFTSLGVSGKDLIFNCLFISNDEAKSLSDFIPKPRLGVLIPDFTPDSTTYFNFIIFR